MSKIVFRREQKYRNVTLSLIHAVQSDRTPRLNEYVTFGFDLCGNCKDIRYRYNFDSLEQVDIYLEPSSKNEHRAGHEIQLGDYTQLSHVLGVTPEGETHVLVSNPSKLLGNEHMKKHGFFLQNKDGSFSDLFDTAQFDAVFPRV